MSLHSTYGDHLTLTAEDVLCQLYCYVITGPNGYTINLTYRAFEDHHDTLQ